MGEVVPKQRTEKLQLQKLKFSETLATSGIVPQKEIKNVSLVLSKRRMTDVSDDRYEIRQLGAVSFIFDSNEMAPLKLRYLHSTVLSSKM